VLFVLPNLQGGGAERVTLDLLGHLDRGRCQPTLFLLKREGAYLADVPPDLRLAWGVSGGRLRYWAGAVLRALVREAAQHDVVVGALELTATYMAAVAARAVGRPLVAWVHTDLTRYLQVAGPIHRLVAPLLYRRLPVVVVPSRGVRDSLCRALGVEPERVVHIPNVLDIDRVQRLAMRDVPPWWPASGDVVLAVGRLHRPKGFDVLIAAHALLRRKGHDHLLVIAGEGPERASLEDLAARLDVVRSVRFAGFVPNPYPLIRRARLVALASRFEGFPMVILEALALGTAVVSTDCPSGPRELLEDGRVGALVPPEDPQALAEAIAREMAASDDEESRRRRVERARAFAPGRVVPLWQDLLARIR
jgi:glycosyltransferase involved in cell wall biosynthesis